MLSRRPLVASLSCLLLLCTACSDDSSTADSGAVVDAGPGADAADVGTPDAGPDTTSAPDAAPAPVAKWTISAGGSTQDTADWGKGLAVDASGNIYLTGLFKTDFTIGAVTLTSTTRARYVAKLDPDGKVLWAVAMEGTQDSGGAGLCLGPQGAPHVAGMFQGELTLGSVTYTSPSLDAFVVKLDPANGEVSWSLASQSVDTSSGASASSCAVDSAGKVLIGGEQQGTTSFGNKSLSSTQADSSNSYVALLSADGSDAELVATFGGEGSDWVNQVSFGPSGAIYAVGGFKGTFPSGSGSFQAVDKRELYIARLSSAGVFEWALAGGGLGDDRFSALAVDDSGNAYAGGYIGDGIKTEGNAFTIGSVKLPIGRAKEAILVKVSPTGELLWAKEARHASATGWAYEGIRGLAFDAQERLVVAGQVGGQLDFFGRTIGTLPGMGAVLARLNSDGYAEWATVVTTSDGGYAHGNDVAVAPSGDVVLLGVYTKTLEAGSASFTSAGSYDVFVHTLTPR